MIKVRNLKICLVLAVVAAVLVGVTGRSSKSSSKHDKKADDSNKHICQLPQENGDMKSCDDSSTEKGTRWFYSCETHKCKRFQFEGCGGNKNKFDSEKDCKKKCVEHKKKKWCKTVDEDNTEKGRGFFADMAALFRGR